MPIAWPILTQSFTLADRVIYDLLKIKLAKPQISGLFISTMTQIESAVYSKCMALAKQYASNRWNAMNSKRAMQINNPWVNLWKAFSKGEIDENETKACFILGYLTQFAEQVCAKYEIRERLIKFA